MYQLRNLINRSAVPKDPADNMKAAEDSFAVDRVRAYNSSC